MSALLFVGFLLLMLAGVPLATALGISGAVVILAADLGSMSIAANVYSSLAKYPLLALPVFILAGMIFERAGVATKLVAFVSALIGPRRGAQGAVAIIVCMFLGGISGSGPADAAAVAMVMLPSMTRQGYPPAFSASIIAAAGSTAILIPPSIAFVIFTVLVPQVSVPALFAAGMIPGLLAGLSLLLPLWGGGPIYLLCAVAGGVWFIGRAWQLLRQPSTATARLAFRASLVQLSVLLLGAMLDAAIRL